MNKSILYFFLVALLINSCNKPKGGSKKVITEDVKRIEMPEVWQDTLTINKSHIIPLETKSDILLGWILNVKMANNTIYVLDQFQKTLYLFDLDGKIKGMINNRGKGPYEYSRIKDFQIYKNYIYILDVKKILVFDKNTLKPVDEFKLGEVYPYSLMISKNNIILSTDNYPYGNILNYLPKRDINMGSAKKYLYSKIKSNDNKMGLILGGYKFHPIPNTNETLFHFTFSNYIYTVSDIGYKCSYEIDFKKKNIPDDILRKSPHVINHYMKYHKYVRIYKPYKIKNTLAIDLDTNIGACEGILTYTTDKANCYKVLKDDVLKINLRIVGTSCKGFIGFISTTDLNTRLKKIQNKKNMKSVLNKNEKYFMNHFSKDCNPCLVIFNFEQ